MDNIINQMIGFESEIHIQVDVEEKNAEGKTGKYLEKENRKIFERRSGKKAVFCPRLESTKKKTRNIARVANAVQVTICLLVSTSVY